MTNKHLVGTYRLADVRCLTHELGVHAQTTSGVNDYHGVLTLLRFLDAVLGDLDGVAAHLFVFARDAGLRREHGHARALADHLELRDGVGALEVRGHEQRRLALLLEVVRELASERGLSGTLQTRKHDDRWPGLGELQRPRLAPKDRDELLVDDLDDLLGRVERAGHFRAERALAHVARERANHADRDVGVEEGATDLANRRVDVCFAQAALSAEVAEGRGEAIGEVGEHLVPFGWGSYKSTCAPAHAVATPARASRSPSASR